MNRKDFQNLSELRLQESKALLAAGLPDGAYYLAGYVIECAFKACIARRTQQHDFPEKGSNKYFSHDLADLLGFAKLKLELDQALRVNPALDTSWTIILKWSEESRYQQGKTAQDVLDLLTAIEDQTGGLLPWLQQHW